MKNFWIYIIILFLLISCGNVGKVLRNEKITTTDEFLVKKRGPLVLPPDYEKVPKPDTLKKKEINQQNKIKQILKAPKKSKKNRTTSSSIEESIIEKIR